MLKMLKHFGLLRGVAAALDDVAAGGDIIELWPMIDGTKLRVQIARVPDRKVSYEVYHGKN